jgi:hypothetical protein
MTRRERANQRQHRHPTAELLEALDRNAPLVPRRKTDDPYWQTPEAWAATWGVKP